MSDTAQEIADSAIELHTNDEILSLAKRIADFAAGEYRRGVEEAAKIAELHFATCQGHNSQHHQAIAADIRDLLNPKS